MFRREGLQAQRIEISDIIFNEILNTASADMAGSASHHSLVHSHPGWFCPHVCPWKGFHFGITMGFRASQLGGLFLEPQQLLPSPWLYHIAARFLQLLIRRGNTSVKCRLLSAVPGQLQCSVPQACCGAFPSLCASQDLLLTKKSLAVTVSHFAIGQPTIWEIWRARLCLCMAEGLKCWMAFKAFMWHTTGEAGMADIYPNKWRGCETLQHHLCHMTQENVASTSKGG